MLPIFRQRLLLAAALVVGGLVWSWAAGPMGAADASGGISLFDARIGVLPGLVLMVAAGLPALGLGVFVSATGNPLSGVFTVACGLMFVAIGGGPIDGYLQRHALPGAYGWLLAEMVLWAGLWGALLVGLMRGRAWLRPRVGRLSTEAYWPEPEEGYTNWPSVRSLLAGLVSAAVAGGMCTVLLPVTDTGQVVGSLLLGFIIGGLLGQLVAPQASPVAILLSPAALGVAAYGYVLLSPALSTEQQVLAAWYGRELWGPALALPIFYASAGVAGAAIGVGMGQSISQARAQAVEG